MKKEIVELMFKEFMIALNTLLGNLSILENRPISFS